MRYEPATQEINDMYNEVKHEHFSELVNTQILILLDTKKCKSKGKLVLGKIKKASEVEKLLTTDITEEGIDYVMFLDKVMTQFAEEIDVKRVIRHELRHIFITERGKLTIVPHSLEDFYEEVDLNRDDPKWALRVVEMVSLIYDQGEDQ